MITTAIKIDDRNWAAWLDAIALNHHIHDIECDAALFSSPQFVKSLDRHSLYCRHARDILPPETARYLNTAPNDAPFNELRKSVIATMMTAEEAGASHFSLQLRLDEPFPCEENRARKTATFLRKLLMTPLEKPFKLDIQIRFPYQYPMSREWERAIAICDTADSKRIGLSLQIYSGDFDDTPPAPNDIIHDIAEHLHAIEFHYIPHLGETLFEDELEEWADTLKTNDFDGLVVFCPHLSDEEEIAPRCLEIQQCMEFFLR